MQYKTGYASLTKMWEKKAWIAWEVNDLFIYIFIYVIWYKAIVYLYSLCESRVIVERWVNEPGDQKCKKHVWKWTLSAIMDVNL